MSSSQQSRNLIQKGQPDSATSASASNHNKRSNVTSACEACRQKKSRCDGQQPCAMCLSAGRECRFPRRDRRRQHERGEPLRILQAELENLQAALNVLRFGSDSDALQALKALRSETPTESAHGKTNPAQPEASRNLDRTNVEGHEFQFTHENDRSTLLRPSPATVLFDVSQPPPRTEVETAARAFFENVAGFLYVMEEEDFAYLCQQMYDSNNAATELDLTEVCAIAAVGLQYGPNTASISLRDGLFRTLVQNTSDVVELDAVRALRCIACLCLYNLVSKRTSVRSLIHSGLQLARWTSGQYAKSNTAYATWGKLYKSMIFLECWLSTTSGYQPDVALEEAQGIFSQPFPSRGSSDDMTQAKIAELGLLRVRVVQAVYVDQPPSSTVITLLEAEMQIWHQSLPAPLTLPTLFNGVNDTGGSIQHSAPILAHAEYLGTIILLHRHILAAMAYTRLGRAWMLPEITLEQAQRSHDQSLAAARSSARIFLLLHSASNRTTLHSRCWLFLAELIALCTVLLYDIAIQLSQSHEADTHAVDEDLRRTETCLTILASPTNGDMWSRKRLPLLTSTYQRLNSLSSRSQPARLNSASSSRHPDTVPPSEPNDSSTAQPHSDSLRPEMITEKAIKDLAAILSDPFELGGNGGFNALGRRPHQSKTH